MSTHKHVGAPPCGSCVEENRRLRAKIALLRAESNLQQAGSDWERAGRLEAEDALREIHGLMVTWFSSEYADHPAAKRAAKILYEGARGAVTHGNDANGGDK